MLWAKRLCQVYENKRGRSQRSELVLKLLLLIFPVNYISVSFCHDILVGKVPSCLVVCVCGWGLVLTVFPRLISKS